MGSFTGLLWNGKVFKQTGGGGALLKKTGNVRINIILRRVRVTIVAVEKQ
jgi:hypothetical protein